MSNEPIVTAACSVNLPPAATREPLRVAMPVVPLSTGAAACSAPHREVNAWEADAPCGHPLDLPVAIPVARPVGRDLQAPFACLPVARLAHSPDDSARVIADALRPQVAPRLRRRSWRNFLVRRLHDLRTKLAVHARSMLGEAGEGREWLISAAVHVVLLIVLACLTIHSVSDDHALLLTSSVVELEPLEPLEAVMVTPEFSDVPNPDSAIALASANQATGAPPLQGLLSVDPPEFSGEVIPENDYAQELLSSPMDSLLGEEIQGARQRTVDAGDASGAVDRLTVEILEQLQDGKLLVVWLMDASGSLRNRREEIISRFNRVYEELDALVDKKSSPLLTGIVAFGQNTVFMTEAPTADRVAITQAVQDIPNDESGVENAFHAVGETIGHWRTNHGRDRTMMLIVLTDEAGDDADALEAAVALAKRSHVRVYAIGPAAPFADEQVSIDWEDKESGEVFRIPVQRGPEAAAIEHPRLIDWQTEGEAPSPLRSGYGPFALARLVHTTGGVYFIDDDSTLTGPRMDPAVVSAFTPDYVSAAEYTQQVKSSPLRLAVLETTLRGRDTLPDLPTGYLAAGIQFAIRGARRDLDRTMAYVEDSLKQLQAVASHRQRESSRRWQAHYDLLVGRLWATKARGIAYGNLVDAMFAQPEVPTDSTKNGWQLACVQVSDAGDDSAAEASGIAAAAAEARRRLQLVVEEYPDTPWSAWAQRELKWGFGLQWQESFIDPPPGVPLPWDKKPWDELTEQEKQAKQDYEQRKKNREEQQQSREEARKRIPKL